MLAISLVKFAELSCVRVTNLLDGGSVGRAGRHQHRPFAPFHLREENSTAARIHREGGADIDLVRSS